MNAKERAAQAALPLIRSGMVVGLGTGSTADYFLIALGRAIAQGQLRDIRGVPTSVQSERRASELRIPLATLNECPSPDITVDGADEVDPQLNLIKGLGGALLREKMVAQASRQLVIIVDASKAVQMLGTVAPLPVEVSPFCYECHLPFLKSLSADPVLRTTDDGKPYLTDNGNYIYHCRFPAIPNPAELQAKLKTRAGIVESGLFINLATLAIIAEADHVRRIEKTPGK